jgi:hypothetical protein
MLTLSLGANHQNAATRRAPCPPVSRKGLLMSTMITPSRAFSHSFSLLGKCLGIGWRSREPEKRGLAGSKLAPDLLSTTQES